MGERDTERTGADAELLGRIAPILLYRSPGLVALLDRERRVLGHSRRFAEIFGASDGATPCYVLYKDLSAPCPECYIADIFEDGQERTTREHGVDRSGEEVCFDAEAVPVLGEDGRVCYVLQVARDVTRLLELEQGLDQAQRLAAVGLTVAGLAHTIKNILAGLEGGMYVVDSGIRKGDAGRLEGGWEMVQKYIEQVTALVKNLLRYSRGEPGAREAVAPGELVGEVVELHASKAELGGIDLRAHVADGLAPVLMDRQAMHASLTNLVSNAMDACTWDPAVGEKEHVIEVRALPREGGGVVFEVQDNGMGISEENQRKVLSAFFTTKGIRGTGLGLLLTKKAAEEHGGGISFASEHGVGTTFTLQLPPAPPDEAGAAGAPSDPPG